MMCNVSSFPPSTDVRFCSPKCSASLCFLSFAGHLNLFDFSYVHDDAVALVVGWKHNHTSHMTRMGVTSDASFYLPNSSLNEGR